MMILSYLLLLIKKIEERKEEDDIITKKTIIIYYTLQHFIRAGKFPESFKLGKIRSFIDKSLNKMKKKENFWSFLF